MSEYDQSSNIKAVSVITPTDGAAAGASVVGSIIDTHQDEQFGSLTYVIHAGTITTGDFTLVLEESDVVTFGGEETVVPAADLVGASPVWAVTDDDKVARVGVVGKKRYQRLELVGANTPVADFSAVAILGHSKTEPVAAQG